MKDKSGKVKKRSRLGERLAEAYNRSSIRYTVFISFTVSALIAVILTGITFYARYSSQIEDTLHSENQFLVEQLNQSLSVYLRNMIRLSDTVSSQAIKNIDVSTEDVTGQLQLLYDANSGYVKNIVLFSVDGSVIATAPPAIVKDTVDVTGEAWFLAALERTENIHFSTPRVQNLFRDSESQYSWVLSLSCAAEITEDKVAKQGVLLIDMRHNGIAELFSTTTLPNEGYMYLVDSEGEIIYHPRHQLLVSEMYEELTLELVGRRDGEYKIEVNGESFSGIVRSVGYTGWEIIGVIPQRGLMMSSLQNILFILMIFFLYFAIIILVNAFISTKLTDPIKQLEHSVQEIQHNINEAEIYVGGSYEIQHLGQSIQQMVNQMHKLTRDIVAEQTQKQKNELNALQAQINPHFLYNTLDIIVWMIEKGQPEDALRIVSALARFFRLSLSSGRNVITVSDELDHVHNYLMIQQMRYKNKFTYEIDADEASLGMASIKLVLQPVVENAIYHGMDFIVDGDGLIRIGAHVIGDDLYLTVEDNGLGMEQSIVDSLLTTDRESTSMGSGIGLSNVHERIVIYFGSEYGISIESEPDVGTKITLHMPAIPYEKMEEKN